MISELLAGSLLGLSGVVPFFHANFILQLFGNVWKTDLGIAVFAISLSVSHAFFELLPSFVFLGGVGGRELNANKEQILVAGFETLVLCALFLPVAYFVLPFLKISMAQEFKYVYLSIICCAFFREKTPLGALFASVIFIGSGVFGSITFFHQIAKEPLFPMLSGFFALPLILLGNEEKQKAGGLDDGSSEGSKFGGNKISMQIGAVFASAASTLFPALTPGVVLGVLVMYFRENSFARLSLAVIIAKVFFDIASVGITGATRSVAAAIFLPVFEMHPPFAMAMFVGTAFFSASFAILIAHLFNEKLLIAYEWMQSEEGRKIALVVLFALVVAFGGAAGVLIFCAASFFGILAVKMEVGRGYLMGALTVPALLVFFGIEKLF
ncbi:hypothetical protein HY989_05580 [Candidatus Micrarchaeota archaeon]|nr:hypothetical protein [Candidatus Micrarchaeota archaeon]